MTADATEFDGTAATDAQATPDTDAKVTPEDADGAQEDSAEPPAHEAADHVVEAATDLGEALAALPEHEAYVEAERAVRESEPVQEAIASFNEQRREFAHARQTGDATEEDLEALQAAQQDLHSMPVMAEYLAAQEELQATLGAAEAAISEPLAVDFGETAGGCCQD